MDKNKHKHKWKIYNWGTREDTDIEYVDLICVDCGAFKTYYKSKVEKVE